MLVKKKREMIHRMKKPHGGVTFNVYEFNAK